MKYSHSVKKPSFKAIFRKYHFGIVTSFRLLTIAGLVFGIYYFAKKTEILRINNVEISGNFKFVNENDFKKIAEAQLLNQKIYKLNKDNLEITLLNNFQGMSSVKMSIIYPDTIKIDISERKPVAVVTDVAGEKYLLDSDGYVLGIAEPIFYDLPTVSYKNKIYVGQFLDKNIVPIAMDILKKAKTTNVEVTSLSFEPDFVTFNTWENIIVYLSTKKDVGLSMGAISELIKKAQESERKPITIDLRYNKVIVLYE